MATAGREASDLAATEGAPLCSTPINKEPPTKKSARTLASAKRKRIESAELANKSAKIMAQESNDELFRRMTGYMDAKFGDVVVKLDDNSSKLEVVTSSVANLSDQVSANREDITAMKQQIKELQAGTAVDRNVDELVKTSIARQTSANPDAITREVRRVEKEVEKIKSIQGLRQGDRRDAGQEERHYWWSRRAVRIWPVVGGSSGDLWKATGDFFFKILEVPETSLSEDSVESVRKIFPVRTRGKTSSRVQNEVRVLFKDVETRDMIYSYAPNLATKRDRAGMRLEVPSHLLGQFKTLERYGRILKARHPQLRWHIKYDDPELSMFLNVKLSEEDKWGKVDFITAREEIRKEDSSNTTSFRERLGSSLSSADSASEVEVMDVTPPQSLPKSATLEKFAKPSTPRWGTRK